MSEINRPAPRRRGETGDKWHPARPARHNGGLTTCPQGARNAALCGPGHRRPAHARTAAAVSGAPGGPATSVGGMTGPNLATRVGAAIARRRPPGPPPPASPHEAATPPGTPSRGATTPRDTTRPPDTTPSRDVAPVPGAAVGRAAGPAA